MANLNGTSKGRERSRPGRQVLAGQNPLIRALAFLWFIVPGLFNRCDTLFQNRIVSLAWYFEREVIVRRLVLIRIRVAKKRHDKHFLFNLNSGHRSPCKGEHPDTIELCGMLPPRRGWLRPTRNFREKRSAKKTAEMSIVWAVNRERQKTPPADWLTRLDAFVKTIQSRIRFINTISFSPPKVVFVEKDKNKKTYRPLATFSVPDQVIIGCAANCLRDTIDCLMSDASYAFRSQIQGEARVRQHHDAVENLRGFILKHQSAPLYVAECDIQKFFDTVNHEVARRSLSSLLADVRAQGRYYDRRLINIFGAYLESYNYQNSVDAISANKLQEMGKVGAHVPWVREELEHYYPDGIPEGVGVPQGGALSPIIANIVLHVADVAVENAAKKIGAKSYFYARYCDDMILISPDIEVTRALFSAYKTALKKLRLPYHKPENIKGFTKQYFDYKSKDVYRFGSLKQNAVSPWISFLGYQVRYDGKLRVRKSSILKEIEKQIGIYRDVLKSIDVKGAKMRVTAKQAHHRAKMRLIAMSVGNAGIHCHGPDTDHEMCWVNGFELLKKYPHAKSQLRALDRVRARLLTKLRFRLLAVLPIGDDEKQNAKDLLKYYGRPFSYFAQFHKSPKSRRGQFHAPASDISNVGQP